MIENIARLQGTDTFHRVKMKDAGVPSRVHRLGESRREANDDKAPVEVVMYGHIEEVLLEYVLSLRAQPPSVF